MKIKTEKDLEAYLVSECEARGWDAIKFTSPGRRGVPDRIIVAHYGVVVFCELKHPNGKGVLSANQEDEQSTIQKCGGYVYNIESVKGVKNLLYYINLKCNFMKHTGKPKRFHIRNDLDSMTLQGLNYDA